MTLKVGIDIGGTFTDFVFFEDGRIWTDKVLSTPKNPALGVLQGLTLMGRGDGIEIIHGSTVATNALLERKGAKVALITTEGFEDILEIGRQDRPKLYDLFVDRPPPLVPSSLRFGVPERVDYQGKVLIPLNEGKVKEVLDLVAQEGVESLAICLLFSYASPAHEERILALAKGLGIPISVSHRILPEYRECERTSTTVVNAYVSPLLDRYIDHLERAIGGSLRIMQSNGGSISARVAREEAVRTVLSGPAAGVVGGFHVAKTAGFSNVITFDMGGTSTDVSLCQGEIKTMAESSIAGCPIRVPMIDIHTVGSGGGSIAYLDEGGALRVGPESAGADPGPVCYGKGKRITVTDANLLLGRLDPDSFLGGRMKLDVEQAEKAMERFAKMVGLSPLEVAEGIVKIANATMEKAIRVISVERGFDPREFCLVSFGGAGGLHAFDLARSLSIPEVLVPFHAGLLSAYGMLISDVVKDYSQSVLIPSKEAPFERLRELFRPLEERGLGEMREEGIPEEQISCSFFLDMRYIGQSYELTVPFERDFVTRFHALHHQTYGYAKPEKEPEIVHLRLRVVGETEKPVLPEVEEGSADASHALLGERRVFYEGRWLQAKLYDRQVLKANNVIFGPAIIVESSATTFLPPSAFCRVDRFGNLLLSHV